MLFAPPWWRLVLAMIAALSLDYTTNASALGAFFIGLVVAVVVSTLFPAKDF